MHYSFTFASLTVVMLACGSAGSNAGDGDASTVPDGGATDADVPDAGIHGLQDGAVNDAGNLPAVDCESGELLSGSLVATTTSFDDLDLSAISLGEDGAIFLGGALSGRATLAAGGPDEVSLRGRQLGSPVLVKYTATGELSWAQTMSTTTRGRLHIIRPLADGTTIVAGSFESGLTIGYDTPQEIRLTAPPDQYQDIFIAKLDIDGSLQWARQVGGGANDRVSDLIVRADGSFIAGGTFADAWSNTLIFPEAQGGSGVTLTATSGWETGWLASFDNQGRVGWVRQFGGSSRQDSVRGLAWSGTNAPVVSGSFAYDLTYEGTGGPVTVDQTGNTDNGAQAAFLASIAPSTGLVTGLTATGGHSVLAALEKGRAGELYLAVDADRESAFDSTSTTPANGATPLTSYVVRYDENLAFEALQLIGTGLTDTTLIDLGDAFIMAGRGSSYRRFAIGPNGEIDSTPVTVGSGLRPGFVACASKTSRRVVWSTTAGRSAYSALAADGTLLVIAIFSDTVTVNEGTPSEQTFSNEGFGRTSMLLRFAL